VVQFGGEKRAGGRLVVEVDSLGSRTGRTGGEQPEGMACVQQAPETGSESERIGRSRVSERKV